jgi:flavodoxin
MRVLIVYGTQFGTTHKLARTIAAALEADHEVRLLDVHESGDVTGDGVDLLFVGAPTQMHGLRLLVRPFLEGLADHGFAGVAAAAFDTRMSGPKERTGAESEVIAAHLGRAGCRLVAPAESFIVAEFQGPLAEGEDARAETWALSVAARAAGSTTSPTALAD